MIFSLHFNYCDRRKDRVFKNIDCICGLLKNERGRLGGRMKFGVINSHAENDWLSPQSSLNKYFTISKCFFFPIPQIYEIERHTCWLEFGASLLPYYCKFSKKLALYYFLVLFQRNQSKIIFPLAYMILAGFGYSV